MQLFNGVFLSLVTAGSSKDSVFEEWEISAPERPRFGRNWWFWKPTFKTNGGHFKSYENTDVGIQFLCFSLSLTVYSRTKYK